MMACKTSFELYHNFPKLAEESGFTFNTHRPRVHIEWNKIRLINIESLIRERKFTLIEQHVNDILDCVLESEFDVRILDEGVLKIFRLAQLAVEYQQFCRHYLDRSVFVLREEVSVLAQELDSIKRLLKEKEEEIRKLRRKSRHSYRTTLPYGNDNIASMILKTLNNKADIFPTLASSDTLQHNKCAYCDKVFLNQLYLESHMNRRHANDTEIPQKDVDNDQIKCNHDENEKLIDEITDLKSKLIDMEKVISTFKNPSTAESKTINDNKKVDLGILKETKDVEVSTNGEGYILDKIEEWKKEEHEKYNKEINLLRSQIVAVIDSNREKEKSACSKDDSNIIAELRTTIKQQGAEILSLKQELNNSKFIKSPNREEIEQRNKIEAQMAYWVNRAELQSNEYKFLLQKLEEIAQDAAKSRAQAEVEKARVAELQDLLQQQNHKLSSNKTCHAVVEKTPTETVVIEPVTKNSHKPNTIRDRNISLQKLQQKAQELLYLENTSTSDHSASSDEKILKAEKINTAQCKEKYNKKLKSSTKEMEQRNKRKTKKYIRDSNISGNGNNDSKTIKLDINTDKINYKEHLQTKGNGMMLLPGSPMKIIRAKITEEVNNHLVSLGVDPLKSRLPQNIFIRQRILLQQQQELKFKKYPRSEQVLHSLLADLDSNASKLKTDIAQTYTLQHSPVKNTKTFSLSSVISNVKTKALSLVKNNDLNKNPSKPYDAVAKKAMQLLKTPPSSTHSSPIIQDQNHSPAKSTKLQNLSGSITKSRNKNLIKGAQIYEKDESDTESITGDHQHYGKNQDCGSATIGTLIKPPTQRPSDTKDSLNYDEKKPITTPVPEILTERVKQNDSKWSTELNEISSDDVESIEEHAPRRAFSADNIIKQTKGVLKNASSTSSLNKKKVIFDMDAIQMKSVSASSPSQTVTEKSDNNEKYALGLINLEKDEWDISSIENEPGQNNPVLPRTSPKIAELKRTIESQLSRRNNITTTGLIGGVDILTGASLKKTEIEGSNTSLGSSILDDVESASAQNQIAFVKPRSFVDKDDSEIDISEFVNDDPITKKYIKTK